MKKVLLFRRDRITTRTIISGGQVDTDYTNLNRIEGGDADTDYTNLNTISGGGA